MIPDSLFEQLKDRKIALYGLGTETERFLNEYAEKLTVVGLLDGFKEEGELFGFPILPLGKAISQGTELVLVIARPGSCKAISRRIGEICRAKGVGLLDVRGKDLLVENKVAYELSSLEAEGKDALADKIEKADVVSFDLFDTLVTRRVYSYTDVFDLVELKLKERGIALPDLAKYRLAAEKELSKERAPRLGEIYERVREQLGGVDISADELVETEWLTDLETIVPRAETCRIFRKLSAEGWKVIVTTDSYYSREQIEKILSRCDCNGADEIFVSCELGTAKTQELFGIVSDHFPGARILHIGDDETADILSAKRYGLEAFRLYSGADMYDRLGGMGLEEKIKTLSDRVRGGMLIATLFNDPFVFEKREGKLPVESAFQLAYLFCAPMVTDFVLWMKQRANALGVRQILFCARDGYLPVRLFCKVDQDIRAVYFLSSRTAAIRAGMESADDIEYVDSMKYSGSAKEAARTRFGIDLPVEEEAERKREILKKSAAQRVNYGKYIEKLGLGDGDTGLFDFVAKGTSQLYLQKLFVQHLKGFYFLQLEPEFMADKGLDIDPFYSDEEKNTSAIYDNYYILETMLTAPDPQLTEFDENGEPIYAAETRSDRDIKVFENAQAGITEYFEEYLRLVPDKERITNKPLDEKLLELLNHVLILDEDFLALKVEDPFFGRMTDIKDVLG